LVAAHPWDVHGAKCAGLIGAFVARGHAFPPFLQGPDVKAPSLLEVARRLAG
jgi:2-haloacid dehalogenase